MLAKSAASATAQSWLSTVVWWRFVCSAPIGAKGTLFDAPQGIWSAAGPRRGSAAHAESRRSRFFVVERHRPADRGAEHRHPDRRGVHEGSEVGAGVAVVAVGARMVDDSRGLRSERHQHLLVSVLRGRVRSAAARAKALRGELSDERADRLRRRGLWVQGEDGWPAWLPARAPH